MEGFGVKRKKDGLAPLRTNNGLMPNGMVTGILDNVPVTPQVNNLAPNGMVTGMLGENPGKSLFHAPTQDDNPSAYVNPAEVNSAAGAGYGARSLGNVRGINGQNGYREISMPKGSITGQTADKTPLTQDQMNNLDSNIAFGESDVGKKSFADNAALSQARYDAAKQQAQQPQNTQAQQILADDYSQKINELVAAATQQTDPSSSFSQKIADKHNRKNAQEGLGAVLRLNKDSMDNANARNNLENDRMNSARNFSLDSQRVANEKTSGDRSAAFDKEKLGFEKENALRDDAFAGKQFEHQKTVDDLRGNLDKQRVSNELLGTKLNASLGARRLAQDQRQAQMQHSLGVGHLKLDEKNSDQGYDINKRKLSQDEMQSLRANEIAKQQLEQQATKNSNDYSLADRRLFNDTVRSGQDIDLKDRQVTLAEKAARSQINGDIEAARQDALIQEYRDRAKAEGRVQRPDPSSPKKRTKDGRIITLDTEGIPMYF